MAKISWGKVPFALICLILGAVITIAGFVAYITNYAAITFGGLFYGIPLLLGGLSFKLTELKPVPITEALTPEVELLRSAQATEAQQQVFKDVTRYRYGEKAHMGTALRFLGLSPTNQERPELVGIYETSVDDCYALVLGFESPMISLENWQKKQEKMVNFFGPGVRVDLTQPEPDFIRVSIICTPSVAVPA
jgi:hypothetical protein